MMGLGNIKCFDSYLAAKQAAYVKKGYLQGAKEEDKVTLMGISATTYAPNLKVPVLYCTPKYDLGDYQQKSGPAIFEAFGKNDKSEFHFIGSTESGAFKTKTNNRTEGYNYYGSEAGGKGQAQCRTCARCVGSWLRACRSSRGSEGAQMRL
eukprot:2306329-Prymnesium_polylepis.1